MVPPYTIVPIGLIKFSAAYFCLQAIAGLRPMRMGWRAWVGAASLVLVLVLMRVYDEIKDAESDIRLGKAGDPRYKDRPLVRRAISVADMVVLRRVVTTLLIVANLSLVNPIPIMAFVVLFVVLWLSSKWFFSPSIANSLLLAFATHNPITLVMGAYIGGIFVGDFGIEQLHPTAGLLLVALWLPVAAWETARKVRIPEDETDYETYSKVLGWKTAALVPAGFVVATIACLLPVAHRAGLPWVFDAVLVMAGTIPIGGCIAFRIAPSRTRARLQPLAEMFAAAVDVSLLLALGFTHGVAW